MQIKQHADIQGASKEEKIKVFQVADKLIADNQLSKGTKVFTRKPTYIVDNFTLHLQITRVVEGIETAIFKQFFVSWNESENESFGFGRFFIFLINISLTNFVTCKTILCRSCGGMEGGGSPFRGEETDRQVSWGRYWVTQSEY